jgi:hypothetical protein
MDRSSCRLAVAVAMLLMAASARGQSLAPVRPSGQTVTPAYEGWYRNPDGTFSLSFGYFNRNASEVLDVPVGADNAISPGPANQGQPTFFAPRRHWGVFAVVVPANFGDKKKVTWTLRNRGETFAISGSLDPLWEIDALVGEAGSNNTPPVLKNGTADEARGPRGFTFSGPEGSVATPITLTISASDDGRAVPSPTGTSRGETPVTLTWFKHQGPGAVTFTPATTRVPNAGGTATTTAKFSVPGEYIIRVRANDASGVTGAGHSQCCWTNGFIKVTVKP